MTDTVDTGVERLEPYGMDDYGCGPYAGMEPDPDGEYVGYSDYAKLQARVAELEAAQGAVVKTDSIAKVVYEKMQWAAEYKGHEWVEGGNSLAQVEARRAEQRILSALAHRSEQDVRNEAMEDAARKVEPKNAKPKLGNMQLEGAAQGAAVYEERVRLAKAIRAMKGGA